MLGAILSFSLTALAGREATQGINGSPLSISQLVFFRNIIGLSVVLLLVLSRPGGFGRMKTGNLTLHIGRNGAHFLGQWCWFYGLAVLPLAQVFAIEFTVPIWTAIFASFILSEKLNGRRILAICLGFLGVLIILRPGITVVPLAAWVVLLGAVAYAFSHTLTKQLAAGDSVLSILFYMHLIQLPLAFVLVCFDFSWPQGLTWLYVAITALAALSAHYCMAKALSFGDAMVVMPMDFLRLPLIATVGAVFYGEAIDLWLLLGAFIMLFGNSLTFKARR